MWNSQGTQRAKCKGSFIGKMKGMANHNCVAPQESEAIAAEEGGCHEMIPTQTTGSSGDKNTK